MKKSIVSLALIALGLVCQSKADTWVLNYTTATATVNATITTGAAVTTFEGNNGFLITDITGDRNGLAITLVPTTVDPTVGASADPLLPGFLFDNVLLTGGSLDYWGLEFSDSNNAHFNFFNQLFAQGGTEYRETSDPVRSWSLKQVPDSGMTIAMLGVTLIGLASLRRRFTS